MMGGFFDDLHAEQWIVTGVVNLSGDDVEVKSPVCRSKGGAEGIAETWRKKGKEFEGHRYKVKNVKVNKV
jgi:hypothetical protein